MPSKGYFYFYNFRYTFLYLLVLCWCVVFILKKGKIDEHRKKYLTKREPKIHRNYLYDRSNVYQDRWIMTKP